MVRIPTVQASPVVRLLRRCSHIRGKRRLKIRDNIRGNIKGNISRRGRLISNRINRNISSLIRHRINSNIGNRINSKLSNRSSRIRLSISKLSSRMPPR
jgi:hypothetical protein